MWPRRAWPSCVLRPPPGGFACCPLQALCLGSLVRGGRRYLSAQCAPQSVPAFPAWIPLAPCGGGSCRSPYGRLLSAMGRIVSPHCNVPEHCAQSSSLVVAQKLHLRADSGVATSVPLTIRVYVPRADSCFVATHSCPLFEPLADFDAVSRRLDLDSVAGRRDFFAAQYARRCSERGREACSVVRRGGDR